MIVYCSLECQTLGHRITVLNMEQVTNASSENRKILHTDKTMQLVIQTLQHKERVEKETHEHATQFIRVESGRLLVRIYPDKKDILLEADNPTGNDTVLIPHNTAHRLSNASEKPVKFYTIYAPPVH